MLLSHPAKHKFTLNIPLPNFPKIDVAPTKGLVNNQIRVQIVEVYPHNRRFSGDTISVVQVINIDNVVLTAIFDVIEVAMRSITLSRPTTNKFYERACGKKEKDFHYTHD